MIYISLESKAPSEDWCRRAREATNRLMAIKNKEERKQFIKSNSCLWVELKKYLLELSYGKCWYSEARDIVSDYDVDHFRPKNRAKNLDGNERDGYHWLAFNWKNYRIAGVICNRPHADPDGNTRGKADYFPIKEGCEPANDQNCDIEDELIYLLDPTNPNDPPLLTFDETGYPKPCAKEGTWDFERTKVTIKLLYLDYSTLVDERKKIWTRCTLLLNEVQNLMEKEISVTRKARIKQIFLELKEMASPKSELSATARACLLSSGNMWARSLV